MIIRPATPADIPAMAAVMAASYRAGFSGILDAAALDLRDDAFFIARFAETWPRMRIAVDGARIMGLTLVTDGHLDMLFIDPAIIGRGVGAMLLADAWRGGARTLECFRENHAARRFYEREGWTLTRAYEREFIGRQHAFVAYERAEAPGASRSA